MEEYVFDASKDGGRLPLVRLSKIGIRTSRTTWTRRFEGSDLGQLSSLSKLSTGTGRYTLQKLGQDMTTVEVCAISSQTSQINFMVHAWE